MAASINLNLNSVFKILIPCNYCSLAAGGGSSVRAPLLHALSSGQGILSSLLSPSVPMFLVSCHRVTVCWVPAVPGSECLIGIVLTGSLVSSASLPHFNCSGSMFPDSARSSLIITVQITAAGLH